MKLFVQGMLFAAVLTMGCDNGRCYYPEESPDTGADTPAARVQVLVIGAGPAGLAAAIEATRAGASVAVLERDAQVRPQLPMSWLFSGTPEQLDAGVMDSGDGLLEDWPKLTGGDPSTPWMVTFAQRNVPDVHDWLEDLGFEFTLDPCDRCGGQGEVLRLHDGIISTEPLLQLIDPVWTSTTAAGLVRDADGAVIGATVATSDGDGWIQADRTIVATGGFLRDLDRVRRYRPELESVELWFDCLSSADGNGTTMLEQAGAALDNPAAVGLYADTYPSPEGEGRILRGAAVADGAWLNQSGQRFTDETAPLSFDAGEAVAAQAGGIVWVVMDHDRALLLDLAQAEDGAPVSLDQLEDAGLAAHADTLDELADTTGMDPTTLTSTIEAWNQTAAGATSDPWRPDDVLTPAMVTPPFHAVRLALTTSKAFGGVRVDPLGQVLDSDGEPIPGLFAAGELTGMAGGSLVGDRGFNGSVSAVVMSGRIAGSNAASQALGAAL